MRRREFIKAATASAVAWPLAARAQQSARPVLGFVNVASAKNFTRPLSAFLKGLGETGYVDGQNVAIEYRWAEGRTERFREIAAEFARLKVDVIVTVGSAVPALKDATSTIPIVFAVAVDPVGSGMVDSLARPGGNVTGVSIQETELAGKRIELLREILPGLRRIAVIANVGYQASVLEVTEVRGVARKFGLDVKLLEIRRAEDISPAFDALGNDTQALYVCSSALFNANIARINSRALGARLPTINALREYVEAGGFMSYGTDNRELFRRAGEIVDKILKGAKPADLPVEQPTKFVLVINLATAKALGLAIPEAFLLRANEVIE